jgi:REP element-mobilizing transposase RayT
MILSDIGEIVKSEWLKSPAIRPDMNLQSDQYVIMPNHIHGIIVIGGNEYNKYGNKNNMDNRGRREAMHGVSTSGPNNVISHHYETNNKGPQI